MWNEQADQKPKAVLLFPAGVTLKGPLADVAMVSADRSIDLLAVLESATAGLVASIPQEGDQPVA